MISRIFTITACIVIASLFFTISCKKVNQKRAVEYYDKEVKNFPESNE